MVIRGQIVSQFSIFFHCRDDGIYGKVTQGHSKVIKCLLCRFVRFFLNNKEKTGS